MWRSRAACVAVLLISLTIKSNGTLDNPWTSGYSTTDEIQPDLTEELYYHNLYGGFEIDQHDDGFKENFNRMRADSRGKILCWGNFPTRLINADLGYDTSELYAQEICAKPQYKGERLLHVGGWCHQDDNGKKRVVFDPSRDAAPNRNLDSLEVKTFCLQRCVCHPGRLFGILPRDFPIHKDYEVHYKDIRTAHILQAYHIARKHRQERPLGTADQVANALVIRNMKQAVDPNLPRSFSDQIVTSPIDRNITCPGMSFPPRLPSRWTEADFGGTTQGFCASVFNGGSKNGNIGGMCVARPHDDWSHSNTFGYERVPWFPDHWIPHPEFSTLSNNVERVIDPEAYRFWCLTRCTCDANDHQRPARHRDFAMIQNGRDTWKIDASKGGLIVEYTGPGEQASSEIWTYIPKSSSQCQLNTNAQGNSEQQQSCSDDSGDPPFVQGKGPIPSPFDRDEQPGKRCTSQKDCQEPFSMSDLAQQRCVVSPIRDYRGSTLALAYCVSGLLASQWSKVDGQRRGLNNLYGRDVEKERNDDICPCNATYVSRGCCDSWDGAIWEESSHRVPVLLALD